MNQRVQEWVNFFLTKTGVVFVKYNFLVPDIDVFKYSSLYNKRMNSCAQRVSSERKKEKFGS